MKFYDSKASFAAGELSPVLAARSDLAAYNIGASELTNCLVLPQGGLINRPGTRKLGDDPSLDGARLVPFVAGAGGDSYCLAFKSDGTVDVYGPAGIVTTITGSPYGAGQLQGLRWLQSVDIIYLFHQDVPVYKLLHDTSASPQWRFQPVSFKNGPYRDMNADDSLRMRLSGGTLSCNRSFFTAAMAGMGVKLEAKIKAASDDILIGSSADFMLFGPSTIETRGNWGTGASVTVYVYRKEPSDAAFPATPFRTWPGDGTNNFGLSVDEEEYGVMYRVTVSGGSVRIVYSSGGGIVNRNLKITAVSSATAATASSADPVGGNVDWTANWALGAFGGATGYPALGIFHQERLVMASTPADPQTLWMSQPASWENFETSIPALDTDSITVTLAARSINKVQGFSTREDLLIFTSEAEWVAGAGSKSDVFTPSSVVIVPSGYRGSDPLDPLDIGQSILFVQKNGKVVRGMGYQLDIDGYSSSEVSILSAHLTEGTRIVRWAYQQEPWSVVWAALENGVVLALTLQQEHQVTAWARQVFNGPAQDVCCVPGDGQDELYMLIGRADGEGSKLVILQRREDRPGIFTPEMYLDDGTDPYVSVFESMELEQNVGNGTIQGRPKQVSGATIRLYRTTALNAGVVTENSRVLDQVHSSDSPYTGDIYVRLPGGMGRQCKIRVENNPESGHAPGPMGILGIFQEVTVHDG